MTTHHESSDDEQSTNPFAYYEPASGENGWKSWSELRGNGKETESECEPLTPMRLTLIRWPVFAVFQMKLLHDRCEITRFSFREPIIVLREEAAEKIRLAGNFLRVRNEEGRLYRFFCSRVSLRDLKIARLQTWCRPELIDDPDAAFQLVLKTLQRRVTFLPFLVMLLISILQLLCVLSPFILALFGYVGADEPIVAIAIASFLVFLIPTLVSIPLTIALGFRKIGALYASAVISLIPLFLTLALWVLLNFSTGGGKFMLVPFVIAAGVTFLFVWEVFRYRRQYEQFQIDNQILYRL